MARTLDMPYLQEIIAAFNSRDADRIASYFTEDCTFWPSRGPRTDGERVHGRGAVRDYLAARFERIPDMRWESLHDWLVDETRAVSVWVVRGTPRGAPPIEAQGVDLWTFRDGLVHLKDTYWKTVER